MGRKKQDRFEFRFYEIPHGESALALLGEAWVGTYGRGEISLHFHNLFEIGYCHYGRGVLILGGEEVPYEDAMVTAVPANHLHTTISEGIDSWEFLYINPDEILQEIYPNNPKVREEKRQILNKRSDIFRIDEYPEMASTVWRILEEMREKKPYYQEAVRNLVKLYVLELMRIQERQMSTRRDSTVGTGESMMKIIPALHMMEDRYAEPLKAAELAECCGLSEPHFRRIFDEQIHMTPMDYLNLLRIQKACKLMSRKDYSMDRVAEECGFLTVSTFERNFRKYLNTTPYRWKMEQGNYQSHLLNYKISALRGWDSASNPPE